MGLSKTEFDRGQMRPMPTQTGYFNHKKGRYIYTKNGGWIDMAHFMFYAGKAYTNKIMDIDNPEGEALKKGFFQEVSDLFAAKHSAFSYEDLPSDKFGADFAINHFDKNSDKTFAQQLEDYLINELGATETSQAPNYNDLPEDDESTIGTSPTETNYSSSPIFIEN